MILSNKFFEVQKFVSATNHVYAANIMLVSKKLLGQAVGRPRRRSCSDAADEVAPSTSVTPAAPRRRSAVAELQAKGMQSTTNWRPPSTLRMRQIAQAR